MFILNRIHQSEYILPHIANFVKTFRKLWFKAEIKKVIRSLGANADNPLCEESLKKL